MKNNYGLKDVVGQLGTVLDVEGDVIECGSNRCGTSIIMAKYLKIMDSDKKIYAFDAFGSGLDVTELENERRLGLTGSPNTLFTYNSFEYVRKKIKLLGLEDTIIPIKGLFEKTLPSIKNKVCFCLIDCDLRKCMTYCAETLWSQITTSGVMLFDDYGSSNYKGVKIAVDSFVHEYQHEILEHGFLNKVYQVRKVVH